MQALPSAHGAGGGGGGGNILGMIGSVQFASLLGETVRASTHLYIYMFYTFIYSYIYSKASCTICLVLGETVCASIHLHPFICIHPCS